MNTRAWVLGAIAAVGLLGGPQRASAQPAADAGKGQGPYVVVVGVGEFADKAISPRPTADADAKALHALLTDKKYLGVSADRAKLLTGAAATRDAIVKAVDAAATATGGDDTVVLAFFGRGSSAAEKPCFLTADSTAKDRAKNALLMSELEPAFKKFKNQNVLLMMDVQYKGGIDVGAEKVVEPSWLDIMKLVFGDEKEDADMLPPNRVLVLGNPPFQDALTKGDHGLFYSVLADGLTGKADQAPYNEGYESDGIVTTRELLKYLEKEIPNGARAVGKTDKEKELEPVFVGRGARKFWVTRNPEVTETVQKRIAAVEALAKAGKLPADLQKEGVNLLYNMPKLNWSQALRKEYQKLADGGSVEDLQAARKRLLDGLKLEADEATAFAKKVLPAIYKLSSEYIKPTSRGELAALALKGLYSEADEPLPADLADAVKAPESITDERARELLAAARLRLGKREDLDGDKAADVTVRAMIAALHDPYAGYYTKEEWLRQQGQLFGRFPGVGIIIRREAVRDGLLVVTPIKNGPAIRAGIQAGDLITEIRLEVDKQGQPLAADAKKVHTTKGLKTDDAVNLITGAPDTPVTLVVSREGEPQPREFRLTRNYVMVETVHGVQRNEKNDWGYYLDEPNKIGYLHLSQFISVSDELGTAADIKRAVDGMARTGLNGLIIDVRNNPGGSLKGVIDICELFVGKEPIVTTKERGGAGATFTYSGRSPARYKNFPIVVMINGNSASASEILAACLQDHSRAVVLGERTYGKGSVQHVEEYPVTGGRVKYTVARYYPPSGRNIDKVAMQQSSELKFRDEWGVKPDAGFEVKLSREELAEWYEYSRDLEVIPVAGKKAPVVDPKKDKQLAKALEHLQGLVKK